MVSPFFPASPSPVCSSRYVLNATSSRKPPWTAPHSGPRACLYLDDSTFSTPLGLSGFLQSPLWHSPWVRVGTAERPALSLVSFSIQLMLNNCMTTEEHSGSTEMMASCLLRSWWQQPVLASGMDSGIGQDGVGETGWGLFPLWHCPALWPWASLL